MNKCIRTLLQSLSVAVRCRYISSAQENMEKPIDMKTVGSYQKQLQQQFTDAGVSEPEVSAEFIIAHVIGRKTLFDVPIHQQLSETQWKTAVKLSKERLKCMPIQYILGDWDFRETTLQMKPPVFIPRPETEELVSLILKDSLIHRAERFLEIGCGSGAMSISLLQENPKLRGVAIDLSVEACNLTAENARRNDVNERLQVVQMNLTPDLVNNLKNSYSPKIYDFIVSNPPYVPTEDMSDLQPEIYQYEDHRALHGGSDGMDIIKLVLQMAPLVLKPKGSLWLEVDSRHSPWIKSYMKAKQDQFPHLHFKHTYDDFMDRSRFCHLQHLPPEMTRCSCNS